MSKIKLAQTKTIYGIKVPMENGRMFGTYPITNNPLIDKTRIVDEYAENDHDAYLHYQSRLNDAIRNIEIQNLNAKSKKPVTFKVLLNLSQSRDLIVTPGAGKSNHLFAYRDPFTGLVVSQLRPSRSDGRFKHQFVSEPQSVFQRFLIDVNVACQHVLHQKLDELRRKKAQNPQSYAEQYKPLEVISMQARQSLENEVDTLAAPLRRQLNAFDAVNPPCFNQYLLFKDTDVNTGEGALIRSTTRVPYLDPSKQNLTRSQIKKVTRFLNVFMDETNMRALAWYFGAALSNVPIYDDTISKMMVVSSSGGGCGKSTLFNALSKALFTDAYRDLKPNFDNVFADNNRFASSSLLNLRYLQFDEAAFNGLDAMGDPDFSGIAVTELKSMITGGYISTERKYSDLLVDRVASLCVVLTNNFPQIDAGRSDLNRRLLAVTIRPSRMATKGRKLGLRSDRAISEYISENVQAFANFFVHYYQKHPYQFTNLDYNSEEARQDLLKSKIDEGQMEAEEKSEFVSQINLDPLTGLKNLAKARDLRISNLLAVIKRAQTTKNSDIRWQDGCVYIRASKQFFLCFDALDLRQELINLGFVSIKKFSMSMFRLGDSRQMKLMREHDLTNRLANETATSTQNASAEPVVSEPVTSEFTTETTLEPSETTPEPAESIPESVEITTDAVKPVIDPEEAARVFNTDNSTDEIDHEIAQMDFGHAVVPFTTNALGETLNMTALKRVARMRGIDLTDLLNVLSRPDGTDVTAFGDALIVNSSSRFWEDNNALALREAIRQRGFNPRHLLHQYVFVIRR